MNMWNPNESLSPRQKDALAELRLFDIEAAQTFAVDFIGKVEARLAEQVEHCATQDYLDGADHDEDFYRARRADEVARRIGHLARAIKDDPVAQAGLYDLIRVVQQVDQAGMLDTLEQHIQPVFQKVRVN